MQAIEDKLVEGAPFHTQTSPQIKPNAKFHPRTATGKLKAVIIPIIPRGFHYSIIKCDGLSDGITNPYNDLDNPQAISQISMISYTSPNPSDLIFPISNATNIPKASFYFRNSSPIYLTISPLLGIGN